MGSLKKLKHWELRIEFLRPFDPLEIPFTTFEFPDFLHIFLCKGFERFVFLTHLCDILRAEVGDVEGVPDGLVDEGGGVVSGHSLQLR